MLRILFTSILALAMAMLTGCGPIYQTNYDYVPPKSEMGKMCITQCTQNKGSCEQMCQFKNQACQRQAHEDAMRQFQAYKNQQLDRGKKVKKSVSDFENTWGCSDSCDCAPAFNSCYSACGGKVIENKVCVAFCDKK